MSRSEFWTGSIKEIKFPKEFTKHQIADFLTCNGYPAMVEEDDEEFVAERNYKEKPIFDINGRIFVSEDLTESSPDEIAEITDNEDGTYFITAGFYNGGTYLREVVSDLIKSV